MSSVSEKSYSREKRFSNNLTSDHVFQETERNKIAMNKALEEVMKKYLFVVLKIYTLFLKFLCLFFIFNCCRSVIGQMITLVVRLKYGSNLLTFLQ